MSKAFLRETDFELAPELPHRAASLPPGIKNYLTEDGRQRLQNELDRLLTEERPPLAADPADIDSRRELQRIDPRIRHLQHTLRTAEVVASQPSTGVVRFGNTVTVRESSGSRATYRLVGVDEAGLEASWISWQSPLAQALLDAKINSHISFLAPAGRMDLEILDIR